MSISAIVMALFILTRLLDIFPFRNGANFKNPLDNASGYGKILSFAYKLAAFSQDIGGIILKWTIELTMQPDS